MEFGIYQKLDRAVGSELVNGHVYEIDSIISYLISNVVVLDIDMFGIKMKD